MNHGKLLNFEFLIDTEEDLIPIIIDYISKKFAEFQHQGIDTVFGLYPMEGFLPWDQQHCQDLFIKIKHLADTHNIKVILISGLGEKFNQITVPFEYHFSPYMLRLVFNNYKTLNISANFNPASEKFLFLGGVPSRYNRIFLLSKLYENDLLKNAEWSFFYPNTTEDRQLCRDFLTHYSDAEYISFIRTVTRSFDQKYDDIIKYFRDSNVVDETVNWSDIQHTTWWKNPIYIDKAVFEKCSFSIISEGPNFWSSDYNYITEKTWRTILYKHPFIFAGQPDQFRYLKNLGFKTFENYLPISDYALIDDEVLRIDAIVQNVKYLISNPEIRLAMINDVEYNFNNLLHLGSQQDSFLNNIKHQYQISDNDFNLHFKSLGFKNTKTDFHHE